MKKVVLVRKNLKTTKVLIAEDGRKLGCPFGEGTAQCGTWCALFDIAIQSKEPPAKSRLFAMCRESLIGELTDDDSDSDKSTETLLEEFTRHQA